MDRPRYEKRSDLIEERAIATAFAARYGLDPFKLSESKRDSDLDYLFLKDRKLYAVGEIKNRSGWKPEYGNIILGCTKVKALRVWADAMRCPALFIVGLFNGIYFVPVPQVIDWEIGVHGRTDRGDAADVEPCYRIPFEEFTCAISKDS